MVTVVGFLLIAALVVILIQSKIALVPVLVILPIIAALICGFGFTDIAGFITRGLGSVLSVVVLFAFAIIYFNILNDVGMFDLFIKKLMKSMGNRVEMVMLVTAVIAAIAHLDGSGATTMVITIPIMLPIYKKMKMSPLSLLLIISLASGLLNMNPWCPPAMTLAATIKVDPQEVWQRMIPVQLFGAVVIAAFCFLLGKLERRKGAGMSDLDFDEMKKEFAEPAAISVSRPVLVFDIVLTLVLIVAMLLGWAPANICFMIALSIALVVNFKGIKAQTDALRKHGGTAINMVLIMMAIGVLTGITQYTGMIEGMAKAILSILPESLGAHLIFLVGLVSPLFGIALGNAATHTAMAPVLAGVITQYGATASQLAVPLIIGTSLAANLSLVGAGPYLALGLAGVEMGQHLRYSFKWVMLINTILIIAAAVLGAMPF
jgi:CitMHS family citrate-Mg2+:H+ or citrate-Ca2+:H+ symporter